MTNDQEQRKRHPGCPSAGSIPGQTPDALSPIEQVKHLHQKLFYQEETIERLTSCLDKARGELLVQIQIAEAEHERSERFLKELRAERKRAGRLQKELGAQREQAERLQQETRQEYQRLKNILEKDLENQSGHPAKFFLSLHERAEYWESQYHRLKKAIGEEDLENQEPKQPKPKFYDEWRFERRQPRLRRSITERRHHNTYERIGPGRVGAGRRFGTRRQKETRRNARK